MHWIFRKLERGDAAVASQLDALWRGQDFSGVAALARKIGEKRRGDPQIAVLLGHLHREGLIDLPTARAALEACSEAREAQWMLLDLLWSREGASTAALRVAQQLDGFRLADHMRLRIAAFLFDAGETDVAMDEYRRLKRRPTFGLYRRGYVRLAAEAARRALDRTQLAKTALRIDERLQVDKGAVFNRLAQAGSSIAIVGNGPIERQSGPLIDCHHCVVRMNCFSGKDQKAVIGERMDVWVRPAHHDLVPLSLGSAPFMLLSGGNVIDRFSNGTKLLTPMLEQSGRIELIPFHFFVELFQRFGSVPSAGALTLRLVHEVQGNLSHEQLFGFAPRLNTLGTSVHRDRIVVGKTPNRHNWSSEAAYFKNLVDVTKAPPLDGTLI